MKNRSVCTSTYNNFMRFVDVSFGCKIWVRLLIATTSLMQSYWCLAEPLREVPTTPVEHTVTQTGASSIRIPIQLPPGIAGMNPNMGLNYSSQNGNGMLGLGWTLTGLSSVTRCPRTMSQDGAHGSIGYNADDRFCIDGERLILTNGQYGASGSEYRLERDNFSKITANGEIGGAPEWFSVKTKSGQTIEYGNSNDSRIKATAITASSGNAPQWTTGVARAWAQNKVRDLYGNYYTIIYDQDTNTGAYYPLRIDYTGNDTVSPAVAPTASVQFITESTRTDVIQTFLSGATISASKRISSIQTYVGTTLVKEYRITYTKQYAARDKSRLTSIVECDGNSNCLPATKLTWGSDGGDGFNNPIKWNQYGLTQGYIDNNLHPRYMADVNGDGLPDIVGFGPSSVSVALNLGNNTFASPVNKFTAYFGPAQGYSSNKTHPRYVVDVNGDGLADIVGFGPDGVSVAINAGDNSFAFPIIWSTGTFGIAQGYSSNEIYPRYLIDVNGDGLPDIVGFGPNGLSVAINSGKQFNSPSFQLTDQLGGAKNYTLVDVNGDGLPDIVTLGANGVRVALNTGSGKFAAPTTWLTSQSIATLGYIDAKQSPFNFVDLNSDGLTDLLVFSADGVMVANNTGVGFAAPVAWASSRFGAKQGWADSDTAPRYLVDVDGDGLPDIVGFSSSGVSVALNLGASFYDTQLWASSQFSANQGFSNEKSSPRFLIDVGGWGLPDIVGFNSNGIQIASNSSSMEGKFITQITGGTGANTYIHYRPLTFKSSVAVYTSDRASRSTKFPQVDIANSIYVADYVISENGLGGTNTVKYTYGGLKYELGSGRGFVGFRWVKKSDQSNLTDYYTEYRQDWPFTGMPMLNQIYKSKWAYTSSSNGLVKQTRITSNCQNTNPNVTGTDCSNKQGASYFIFAQETIESAWDQAYALPVVTSTYTYAQSPQQGDVTKLVINSSDGKNSILNYTYAQPDLNLWILGRVQKSILTKTDSKSAASSIIRTDGYKYNANGFLVESIVEPDSSDVCRSTVFGYDGFGNRNSTSVAACTGVTSPGTDSASSPRTSIEDFGSDGHFPIKTTNALNQTESKSYDNKFGNIKSLTGPNQLTTRWEYDGLGRKTNEIRADGTSRTWSYILCTQTGSNCPSSINGVVPIWVKIEQAYKASSQGKTSTNIASPGMRQYYDILNRTIRIQKQGFDITGTSPILVQDTTYDVTGQVSKKSDLYSLGIETPIWTSYIYDPLARVTNESHPDPMASGGIAYTTTQYDGTIIRFKNAAGQETTSIKDKQGRIISINDPKGNKVDYSYDLNGNVISINAAGSVASLTYDILGRKVGVQDTAIGSWTYQYNVHNELVSQRDSLGQVTTFTYDNLGRMVQKNEPDLQSWWNYETRRDGAPCVMGVGKLCETGSDNGYRRKHDYDIFGRPKSTETVLDNAKKPSVIYQSYDLSGRVASKKWPTGHQVTYSYTPLGYLKSISGSGGGVTQSVKYQVLAMNSAGNITQFKLGDKITTIRNYDSRQRMISQSATISGVTNNGAANPLLLQQEYSYDTLGNLLTRKDVSENSSNITSENFSYDSLNRLTVATLVRNTTTTPQSTQVIYDARGNIVYKSDVGRFWYDPVRPSRMTQVTLETAPGATVPLSGGRALSYAFDDYQSGAQLVNATKVGNGNLSYTVSHDAINNWHTVRYEQYTSYNMPKIIAYSNFSPNSFTCLPGYTLTAGMCSISVVTVTPPVLAVGCPAGTTTSGSNCITKIIFGAPDRYGQCTPVQYGSGYINTYLESYNCVGLVSQPAGLVQTCKDGSLVDGKCVTQSTIKVSPGTSNVSDRTLTFSYGSDHQRVRENVALSGNGTSSYFAGDTWYLNGADGLDLTYEKEIRVNGTVEHRHYLSADGRVFALVSTRSGKLNGLASSSVRYFQHDQIGSIVVASDESGNYIERLAYDPWGKRRNASLTNAGTSDNRDTLYGVTTDRGYTEHEHLDEIGIIHMNGRLYDPLIGRFMSADPHVTNQYDLRSFNRYSYVYNNPFAYTDPTGYDAWGSDHSDSDGGVSGGYGGNTSSGLNDSQANQVAKDNGISAQAAQNAYAVGLNAALQAQISNSSTQQSSTGFNPAAANAYAKAFNSYVSQNVSYAQMFANSDGGVLAILNAIKQISSFATLGFSDRFAANMRNGEYGAATGSLGLAMLGIVGNLASDGTSGAVRVAAKEAAAVTELTAAQLKNVERFMGKVPANAKESLTVRALPNEGVAAQAVSPGRVPGSSAVYEKQIDATGKTIQYTKTTYDPAGNIVHVKDKINNGVFP